MSYILNIQKDRDTGEFKVTHNVDGSINENLTYYTDDEIDAAQTLMREAQNLESKNIDFTLGSGARGSLMRYARIADRRIAKKFVEKL